MRRTFLLILLTALLVSCTNQDKAILQPMLDETAMENYRVRSQPL